MPRFTCKAIYLAKYYGKKQVYPLLGAMTFVTSMCIFQLTRNVFTNPDVRINKDHRKTAVLENYEEGERYAEHGFRRFLRTRPPEIMPTINHFFSDTSK
ncbi:NADH-ubiquinone reductase complex 1 MLRQ subunit [Dillenia turbinata]|uniref:NADH-ubiquinone reductase complex 1 MLRQ subunit n=1 Tax=Dillenia turbinata TaxID=194707 RepID=A0AAN8UNX3_9MAGN